MRGFGKIGRYTRKRLIYPDFVYKIGGRQPKKTPFDSGKKMTFWEWIYNCIK
jgi:hypothetical protein